MREFHSFRVEAIVLRHADWGEADRVITLLTRERGKLRANAKGARRPRSRKAGHLEPVTRVLLQLAASRDMPIITQADTLDAYLPIHEDLLRTGYAVYVLELIDRFTYEDDSQHADLFEVLAQTLTRIASEADPWLAVRYYEVRLLDYLGFRPLLFRCANCSEEIKAVDQFFSPLAGGVLCPRCGGSLPGAWTITLEALKYLRHFQRSDYASARKARPVTEVQKELETLMQRYFTYLLERELNTPGFIRSIKK